MSKRTTADFIPFRRPRGDLIVKTNQVVALIMRAVNRVDREIGLVLDMPGCFLLDANAWAKTFFWHRAGKRLKIRVPKDHRNCLCKILVGAQAVLSEFCPLEVAYKQIKEGKIPEPQPFALRYLDSRDKRKRRYDLFLLHTRRAEKRGWLYVCMLPFPDVAPLLIEDFAAPYAKDTGLEGLTRVPRGIHVEIPSLLKRSAYTLDELIEAGIWDRVRMAGAFYRTVLELLDLHQSIPRAWNGARRRHKEIKNDIPLSVFFGFKGAKKLSEAKDEIYGVTSYPLDAPVLTNFVYEELRSALDARRPGVGLKRAARIKGTGEDIARRYKLYEPLDDLVEQSRSMGWLSLDYARERSAVLDELYGG